MSKNGFTLAEVLITLGVVSVISAMTLPTLIQNYRNHVVETRLKKFYSTFNQAIQKSVADNGEYIYWEYFDNIYSNNLDSETITNRVDKYIKPYLKITKEKEIANYHLYYFADGSAFMYISTSMRDILYFPMNPDKYVRSGISGSSRFNFIFVPISNTNSWKYHYRKGLEPFYFKWNGDISSLYTDTTYGCKDGNGSYCTGIIMQNNWKIPKDYPKKIKF